MGHGQVRERPAGHRRPRLGLPTPAPRCPTCWGQTPAPARLRLGRPAPQARRQGSDPPVSHEPATARGAPKTPPRPSGTRARQRQPGPRVGPTPDRPHTTRGTNPPPPRRAACRATNRHPVPAPPRRSTPALRQRAQRPWRPDRRQRAQQDEDERRNNEQLRDHEREPLENEDPHRRWVASLAPDVSCTEERAATHAASASSPPGASTPRDRVRFSRGGTAREKGC